MKRIWITLLVLGAFSPCAWAQEKQADKQQPKTVVAADEREQFKARRKQITQLIKKYKKAPAAEQAAIKAQLTALVSEQVDAQLVYMKNRIAAERANLDNWEAKIKADEANLAAVKAQRVEDLLSGEAEKKQKAARKAWKKQMKQVK